MENEQGLVQRRADSGARVTDTSSGRPGRARLVASHGFA